MITFLLFFLADEGRRVFQMVLCHVVMRPCFAHAMNFTIVLMTEYKISHTFCCGFGSQNEQNKKGLDANSAASFGDLKF